MPILSIIIPTLNRYEVLSSTVKDLLVQTFSDFEIIIVDQSPEQQIIEFADPRIRYFYQSQLSASRARNKGISESEGEILLFLDDDLIIKNKDFLLNYISIYQKDEKLSGVTGPVLSAENPSLRFDRHWMSRNKNWGWLFFPVNYGLECMINSAISCNMSVRKQYAVEVGGMNEIYEKGAHREESDFNERLTRRFGPYLYSPDCVVWHIGNPEGGIRTWSTPVVKAQHHFDSSWYFLFKRIRLIHYPAHLFAMVNYFLLQKKILANPKYLAVAIGRFREEFIIHSE